MSDGDRIQPGIAFRSGERPSPCYRLLLLNADPGSSPTAVRDCLAAVHDVLQRLARGEVCELAGQPAQQAEATTRQFEELQHLVAFGRRLFDSGLTGVPRPEHLSYLPADGPFPALRWEDGAAAGNRGEADVAVQLTGPSQAAVNCAAVEVWKLLRETDGPLRPVASFDGFGRHDGRGWLEFHDGVSNMHSTQRRFAVDHIQFLVSGLLEPTAKRAVELHIDAHTAQFSEMGAECGSLYALPFPGHEDRIIRPAAGDTARPRKKSPEIR